MIDIYGREQVCDNFCQDVSEIPRARLVGQHVPSDKSFYWHISKEKVACLMMSGKHEIVSSDVFPPKCLPYAFLLDICKESREFTFDDDGGFWR